MPDNTTLQPKLVNGLMFAHAVDFLKAKKGGNAVRQLESSHGSLIFDHYRMYPLDDLMKLHTAVLTAVFGTESDEGYYQLGRFTYEAFSHTLVGATLTNVAHSPKEMLDHIQSLWSSVVNFGTRTLVTMDEKKGVAVLEIADDPRNPAYIRGVVDAGLAAIHAITPHTGVEQKTGVYIITITWKPQEEKTKTEAMV